MVDIVTTYGALLLGGFLAIALSGIVTVQSAIYFKLYPLDLGRVKALVVFVWILDSSHTVFVCASVWDYLITHFGDAARINYIPWTVSLSIVFTAILTFCVHCFFAHRIFKLSKNSMLITGPIIVLALFRLGAASVTTAEMIRLQNFSEFVERYSFVFTLGLSLSSLVDILITTFLCYFLRTSRTGHATMDHVLDALMLYAFEIGSLTCAATVVSMICWLAMPHNLVFLGLHFVISKLYANSILATLNTRRQLQRRHTLTISRDRRIDLRPREQQECYSFRTGSPLTKTTRLEINVEQTIQREVDEIPSEATSYIKV